MLVFYISCGTQENVKNRKDTVIDLLVKKKDFEIPKDTLESPIYEFDIYIEASSKYQKKVEVPLLNAINDDCKWLYEEKISLTKKITSLNDILDFKNKTPFFLIENENNQFKYFFNFRSFKNPVEYIDHNISIKLFEPIRNVGFDNCIPIISYKEENKIDFNKEGEKYLGKVQIYQYDLKINLSDQKIKLHYISNGHITSSNWIDISEKTERLDKLFKY